MRLGVPLILNFKRAVREPSITTFVALCKNKKRVDTPALDLNSAGPWLEPRPGNRLSRLGSSRFPSRLSQSFFPNPSQFTTHLATIDDITI